jgi:pimeloyl-ACP methyl ester carboxylesterase
MKVLLLVAALMGAPPELAVTLGRDAAGPAPDLTVRSTDRGTDDLSILREGEWSVGQVSLAAPAVSKDGPALVLRLKGAAAKAPRPTLVRRGPVPLPDGKTFAQESYVTTTRRDGEDVVAMVPFPPVAGVEDRYDLIDLTHSIEWAGEPALEEDVKDRAPLGARRGLVLVPGEDGAVETFKTLRESSKYEELRRAYKPYVFRYPRYRSARENGEALARLVQRQLPGLGAGRLALVSHGAGGVVMRYGAAQMTRKVGALISFAGAHHGSIMASLLYGNERLAEKLGSAWWLVLKAGQRGAPDTPGLRSACWDNHDGLVTQSEAREMGVRVNAELAAFNAADPNLAKLVCLQGDVASLATQDPMQELLRQGAAAFHPVFANSDPFVSFGSGVLEGSSRHQVHTYPGLDHGTILAKPEPWADALGYLER